MCIGVDGWKFTSLLVFLKQVKNHKSFRHLHANFVVVCSLRFPDNGLVSDQSISNYFFPRQIYYKLWLLFLLNPKSYWLETWISNYLWQKKSTYFKKIRKRRHVDNKWRHEHLPVFCQVRSHPEVRIPFEWENYLHNISALILNISIIFDKNCWRKQYLSIIPELFFIE